VDVLVAERDRERAEERAERLRHRMREQRLDRLRVQAEAPEELVELAMQRATSGWSCCCSASVSVSSSDSPLVSLISCVKTRVSW
jgi:hypothetical protein